MTFAKSYTLCRLIVTICLLIGMTFNGLYYYAYDRIFTMDTMNPDVTKPCPKIKSTDAMCENLTQVVYDAKFALPMHKQRPPVAKKAIPHTTVFMRATKRSVKFKQNPDTLTSSIYSRYRLVTPINKIIKGSIIHVAIEAFDESQKPKKSGGDYWQAVMCTHQPYQASTSGRVIDYNNGTYSAYFYAAWSGHAEINITLVHPSIAVNQYLDKEMWNYGPKVFWSASFENVQNSIKSKKMFDTICWVMLKEKQTKTTCEYPPTRDALGDYTFVCDAPKDGHCRPLSIVAINVGETFKHTTQSVGKLKAYFESQFFNKRLSRGPLDIIISGKSIQNSESGLTSFSHGYWTNYTWTSLLYKDKWTNTIDMRECLRNKTLILLGDSTSRQWAYQIPHLLQLPNSVNKVEFPEMFFENTYTQLNLTVIFRFHPQPITSKEVPFRMYRYFVEIIDSINVKQCNSTILMISPWAHFPQWTHDSLIQRYGKIKDAVKRLRARCPNIPIIVKGGHVREHDWMPSAKFGWSDYTLKQIGQMLKNVFADVGIWFLDVWDMNESYPIKKFVHMPKTVVEEELKLAIPYLCHH